MRMCGGYIIWGHMYRGVKATTWRCVEVYGGVWRCVEVCGGVWRCMEVSGGVWRYCIIGNFRGRKLP